MDLKTLDTTALWARMLFKDRMSRSMVIKKGRVTRRFTLQVQGEVIPSVVDNTIKCLGEWFNASRTDNPNVKDAVKQTVLKVLFFFPPSFKMLKSQA